MRRIPLFVALLTLGLLAIQPAHPARAQAPSLAPSLLDFGDLPAHSLSPAQTLTFTNTAATAIELTNVSLVSLNAPLFLPLSGEPNYDVTYFVFADLENPASCIWRALGPDARWTVLNPGEACTVSVRFNPTGTTSTTYTGELSVSYTTSGGSPETSTASLSGTATGPMACDPDLAEKGSNANVNVNVTSSTSEVESTRGAGSPPLVEVGQATLHLRNQTAVSHCGSSFLGNPDDYSTWIALGPGDVLVTVALEAVTVRYLELTPPDPGEDHGFLLLADQEITSDGPAAFVGDAHSNGKIDLKKGAPSTYDGTLTAVGDLKMHWDNTVTGDALAGGKLELKKDATVEGTAEGYASVAPVDLPVLDFSAGGDEVKVKKDGLLTLPPGTYGKLTVEEGATLEIAHDGTSGDYFFEELVLKKEATLTADAANGPVRVHSVGAVKFEKESNVTVTGAAASPSRALVINSLGDIDVKKEARLQGTLVAGGTVRIDKDVWFQGSIAAEKIDLQKDLVLLHHDAPAAPVAAAKSAGRSEEASRVAFEETPEDYVLAANYPNPFNPSTTIEFALPEAAAVRLVVYDVMGREVARLVDGALSAGQHQVRFDASRLASGLYLYRIQAGEFTATRRMMLMK